MYIRIITITMRHSKKRRILRLSISPTSPHREVANRHIQQRTFRRIAPVASCEVDSILHIALCLVNSFKCGSRAAPNGAALFVCRGMVYLSTSIATKAQLSAALQKSSAVLGDVP